MLTRIEIAHNAEIGKRLFIGHLSGIIIGHGSKIGDYPSFHQDVTIGGAGRGDNHRSSLLDDCCYFGAGAKVLGKITVGTYSIIGANSVVVKDVPDNATVAGVPAKVIDYEGSADFMHYRKKDV